LKVIIPVVSNSDVSDALFPALAEASDRPALSFPDRTLTYAELDAATYRVAGAIRRHERVAVIAEPTLETAVAVVGALRAAVPIVLINPKSGSAELEHILSDAEPEAVLVGPGTLVSRAFEGLRIVDVSDDTKIMPLPGIGHGATGEAPALIVYTSGTTGPPKGAVLPQRAIASNLDALAQAWQWTADDVVAHALPLFHVHGLVLGILGPLRRGGRAMHLGRFAPDAVREALAGEATMLFGVPTMYRRLADAAQDDDALAAALGGARLLVSGSAALPAAEHERLQRLTGRTVVERYGMTETLMNTAIPAGTPPAPGTVGPAVPGVEVRLRDDDGAEIEMDRAHPPTEAIGEVHVRGPNLFLGYLNRPDATAQALRDGWFATGDMGVWTAEGNLRLVGRRATDLIKSGGFKIGAGEIEAALREHPAVDDAAVTGEPDDDLGERVVAWVVLRDGETAPPQELVDHVAGMLAPHKRPREVRFLDDLPRNELGKVQKKRLGI
jgi:malonyl-CoA/methylmalonyl-CoA synthetase